MKQFFLALFISLSFIGPTLFVSAQGPEAGTVTSIVSCGRIGQPECGFNDLVQMVQNGIEFTIVYIIIPLVTLVILYYGVMMIVAGNKPAQLQKAKKALWSVVVGLFFMLTAWVLVVAVIKAFDVKLQKTSPDRPLDPNGGAVQLLDIDN